MHRGRGERRARHTLLFRADDHLAEREARAPDDDPERREAERDVERGHDGGERGGKAVHSMTRQKISQTWLASHTGGRATRRSAAGLLPRRGAAGGQVPEARAVVGAAEHGVGDHADEQHDRAKVLMPGPRRTASSADGRDRRVRRRRCGSPPSSCAATACAAAAALERARRRPRCRARGWREQQPEVARGRDGVAGQQEADDVHGCRPTSVTTQPASSATMASDSADGRRAQEPRAARAGRGAATRRSRTTPRARAAPCRCRPSRRTPGARCVTAGRSGRTSAGIASRPADLASTA